MSRSGVGPPPVRRLQAARRLRSAGPAARATSIPSTSAPPSIPSVEVVTGCTPGSAASKSIRSWAFTRCPLTKARYVERRRVTAVERSLDNPGRPPGRRHCACRPCRPTAEPCDSASWSGAVSPVDEFGMRPDTDRAPPWRRLLWQRLSDESSPAHDAFCVYLELGPERSGGRAVAEAVGKHRTLVGRWSSRWAGGRADEGIRPPRRSTSHASTPAIRGGGS